MSRCERLLETECSVRLQHRTSAARSKLTFNFAITGVRHAEHRTFLAGRRAARSKWLLLS